VGHARRDCILEAARVLFSHYGVKKTSVADIASKADVAVGSVYLEFHTKDAIVAALAEERHRRVLEAQSALLACDDAPSVCLARALDARVKAFRDVARGGNHESELFHCARECVEKAHARFRELEEALYTEYLARVAGADDAPVRARTLLLAYAAFEPPMLFRAPDEEVDRELAAMHALVLPGVLGR
jgi:AcrR family transcriptional regulator